MSDLICRKSMTRCQTPGMCSPHGGCWPEDSHMRAIRSLRGDCADLIAERDQLRAEVAGLKTGYEAYERVNAELKAENERLVPFEEAYRTACNVRNRLINEGEELRKALAECVDSLQGEMLQKFGGQLPEDMHPVTRRDYDRDMAELAGYRAAIGKGEQS